MSTTLPQTKEELIDWLKGTPAKNPPPATFHAHGKDWFPHTPGDPMPCDPTREVWVLFRDRPSNFSSKKWNWHDLNIDEPMEQIIGWRYAAPQPEQPDELETLRADVAPLLGVIQSVFAADSNAEIFGKLKELRRSFEEFTEKHPTLKLSAK